MTPTQEAARILFDARESRTPIARLPEHLRPADPEAALAIQREVTRMIGEPIAGWKCGVPRPGRIGIAPIFASTIYRESPCPALGRNGMLVIEPEIAFIPNCDLPRGDYSEAEIREAIGEARLVVEILGSRYTDPDIVDFPEKMADHVMNQGLFVGPPMTAPIGPNLDTFPVSVEGPTEAYFRGDGKHPDGNPFPPFAWAVNYLAAQGTPLRKGDVVTTGSYAGFVTVPLNTPLRVTWGTLGAADVQFISL